MELRQYRHEAGFPMTEVTINTNGFGPEDHPQLWAVIDHIRTQGVEEDLTIDGFDFIPDPTIELNWEKARYVAENLACLLLAELSAGWGLGYRSDDGYDYLTAALDNVRFLTDIDLDEKAFMAWWDSEPYDDTVYDGHYMSWGGSDGELRFILFPDTAAEV